MIIDSHPVVQAGDQAAARALAGTSRSSPTAAAPSTCSTASAASRSRSSRCGRRRRTRRRERRRSGSCCAISPASASSPTAAGSTATRSARRSTPAPSAYVSKRSSPTTMRSAVDAVVGFDSFIDPDIETGSRRPAEGHPAAATDPADVRRRPSRPTRSARRLGLSTETVRTHAKASLPRLGARDRPHAVAIALRSGLID